MFLHSTLFTSNRGLTMHLSLIQPGWSCLELTAKLSPRFHIMSGQVQDHASSHIAVFQLFTHRLDRRRLPSFSLLLSINIFLLCFPPSVVWNVNGSSKEITHDACFLLHACHLMLCYASCGASRSCLPPYFANPAPPNINLTEKELHQHLSATTRDCHTIAVSCSQ